MNLLKPSDAGIGLAVGEAPHQPIFEGLRDVELVQLLSVGPP
jgi:hypothetical protein